MSEGLASRRRATPSSKGIQKIGVLTGGGDCPGLNAVVRAVVKSARNLYDWDVVGIADGFDGIISLEGCRVLTTEDVRGILPRGGTILGTTNRGNPFSYPDRYGKREDLSHRVVENLERLGIDALIVIGGDGTLSIAQEFCELGVKCVGIPKTIDNDLSGTDVTFGFDTACVTATEAIDKLHTTAESHHRAMILEVMGRNAGWIAIESGIAGGADVILIPEIPFRMDAVVEAVAARERGGRKFSIIVVAEGAAPAGGSQMRVKGADAHGARFAGMGNWLGRRAPSIESSRRASAWRRCASSPMGASGGWLRTRDPTWTAFRWRMPSGSSKRCRLTANTSRRPALSGSPSVINGGGA
jgi:ATP-dependent phosphofructokinase / diphosphate-dependent phosphofructokinase